MKKLTDQEQKDQAHKAYRAIVEQALEIRAAKVDPATKAYRAKCDEIDRQEDVNKLLSEQRTEIFNMTKDLTPCTDNSKHNLGLLKLLNYLSPQKEKGEK